MLAQHPDEQESVTANGTTYFLITVASTIRLAFRLRTEPRSKTLSWYLG